ncbi:hypothetical protein [Pseudomonas glycinae]|uniref:Uncharacterized protein n=1 Tax=Pseudomonas glycinae TaxID=1785145 RepID=A0ABM6QHL8_9PSED|nr:hypothetical protein [Pseudomonas glycinae]AUG97451.1 hypothetical protein AWU82_28760 [Pseudomonas glycinae]
MDSKVEFEKARKNIINVKESKTLPLATYFTGGASFKVDINGVEHSFETKEVTTDWLGGADHVEIQGSEREQVSLMFHSKLKDGFHHFNNVQDAFIGYVDKSGIIQPYVWHGSAYVAVSDDGKTKYGVIDVTFIQGVGEDKIRVRGGFFCHLN